MAGSPSALATEIAFRFVHDWQSGRRPRLEDALAQAPPTEWDSLLLSLLTVEVNARRNGGEVPTFAEYLQRFPKETAVLAQVFPQPSAPVPVAQFLPAPIVEELPPEPEPEPTPSPAPLSTMTPLPKASTRPVWLLLGAGGVIALVACVGVVLAVLPKPTAKTEPTPVVKNNETPPAPKPKDKADKTLTDPERATAEWVLRIGGSGAVQSGRGRVRLVQNIDLPKSAIVMDAIVLPNGSEDKWGEADLNQLRYREKLTELELWHDTALTTAALQNIAKLPLRRLELRGSNVQLNGAILGTFTQLEILTLLTAPAFTDADLAEVLKSPNIHTLKISSPKLTADGFGHLPKLAFLRSLTLGADCTLTPDHIRRIATLKLEEFTSFGGVTDDVFAECAVFVELKRCVLRQASLGNSGAKAFGAMRRLEEVRVTGSNIGSDGFKAITELKELRVLELPGAKIVDADLEEIDQLPNLKELYLGGAPLTDAVANKIANCERLEVLDLSGSKLTDRALMTLTKHETLRRLVLQRTGVTAAGVKAFETATPKCTVLWK